MADTFNVPFSFRKQSGGNVGRERRRDERHVTNALSCQIGTVADISASGMKVACEGKPPLKKGQFIAAKLDSGTQRIAVQARVHWIKRRGFKSYTVGFQFINLKDSLKAAIQSLGKFGYVDLEAAAQQKMKRKTASPEPSPEPSPRTSRKPRPEPKHEPKREQQPIEVSVDLPDYYSILGVACDATASQLKAAFHALAKRYHPDVAKSKADAARFTEVTEAYGVLRDAQSRRSYDLRRAG